MPVGSREITDDSVDVDAVVGTRRLIRKKPRQRRVTVSKGEDKSVRPAKRSDADCVRCVLLFTCVH